MTAVAQDETLGLVRDSVRRVLTQSAAFRALPPTERRALAHDMVKVARYMVDAGGETAGVPMNAIVASPLNQPPDRADQVRQAGAGRRTASEKLKQSGNVAQSGVDAFGSAIQKADFPGFVGGLVEGVFNAIVTSSIRQMEAYGTLVANIAKSVDEYMRDNISENQARDYLAGKYPDQIKVDTSGKGGPKAVPVKAAGRGGRGGARGGGRGGRPGQLEAESEAFAGPGAQSQLPDFMKDLGLPEPVTKLDQKTVEETLVPAARRRMAMDRQQLLATMVLMGINRLIVTDGKISASCMFELDTRDAVYEDSEDAASFDEEVTSRERKYGFWFIPSEKKKTTSNFNVSTFSTSSSESELNLSAQMGGNVEINFRSETFPLEKMADVLQIREIEQKAPAAAPAPAPAAGPPMPPMQLPPPPPLPAMPGAPGAAPAPAPPAGGG